MADTIGGGINDDGTLQNTVVIEEADLGKIDIVNLDNAGVTELAVNAKLKNLEIGLAGDNASVIAGKKLIDAKISNEAPKGKTAEVSIANKKTNSLQFSTSGKGATDLTFAEGTHTKFSVTTAKGKAKDEITFGGSTTLNKGSVSTGRGADMISLTGGLTLKGQTEISTGKGKDIVEVGETVNGNGSLLLADFSKKDRLKVGDDTLKFKDIKAGDAPSFIEI